MQTESLGSVKTAEQCWCGDMGELEKYMVPYNFGNPCQDCSYPIIDCPWLHEGKPVPGWKAKLKTRPNGRNSDGSKHWFTTYAIEYCPRYIQIPPRESSPAALTREQDKWFMERNKRK